MQNTVCVRVLHAGFLGVSPCTLRVAEKGDFSDKTILRAAVLDRSASFVVWPNVRPSVTLHWSACCQGTLLCQPGALRGNCIIASTFVLVLQH